MPYCSSRKKLREAVDQKAGKQFGHTKRPVELQ